MCQFIFRFQFKRLLKSVRITNIDSLSGVEFETFIANYFKYLGFKITITPTTGDNGVDIIAKRNGFSLGIQAKLYYKHNISNSAIQEVFSGKSYYKCDYAMVVTNWTFSKPAQKLAKELKVAIIDREMLSNLLTIQRRKSKKILFKLILGY